jgi:hypothetical protein
LVKIHRFSEFFPLHIFGDKMKMHVLDDAARAAWIPLAALAIFALVAPQWKRQRTFVLSVLILECFVLVAEYAFASWLVANVWL